MSRESKIIFYGSRLLLLRSRPESNFTQEELGKKLGVTNGAVGFWEKGVNTPTLDKVLAMAEIFKVDANELYRFKRPEEMGNDDESKKDSPPKPDHDPECAKLCKELREHERDTLKKYGELSWEERKDIWKKWDTDVSEAKKKPREFPAPAVAGASGQRQAG